MTDPNDQAKEIAIRTAGTAVGAVALATATALQLGPEASVGLAVFAGSIPSLIRNGFSRRAARRTTLGASGVEEAAQQLGASAAQLPSSESNEDVFVSMFYDLVDAADDACARPLGHLAMTYAHFELRPDRFFRAFGRVVRELDSTEIRDLTSLLRHSVARCHSLHADSIVLRTPFRDLVGTSLEARGPQEPWQPLLEVTAGVRLLSLMKQHGLAIEPTDEPGVIGGAPVKARLWLGFAQRALSHLELTTPAQPEDG